MSSPWDDEDMLAMLEDVFGMDAPRVDLVCAFCPTNDPDVLRWCASCGRLVCERDSDTAGHADAPAVLCCECIAGIVVIESKGEGN